MSDVLVRKDPLPYEAVSSSGYARLYRLWDGNGGHLSKVDIERRCFGDVTSQGQGITGAWRDHLGIETKEDSKQTKKIRRAEEGFDHLATSLAGHGLHHLAEYATKLKEEMAA